MPGDGTHWRVGQWEDGTTEPGSSGSGLWDPDQHLVGQLHGGYASCSSITSDCFGRLSRSWNGGGASANRLKDWLDPDNTGVLVADGRYHESVNAVGTDARVPGRTVFTGLAPNPAEGSFAVHFDLASYARVGADVFDASGRLIGTVPAKSFLAGSGSLEVGTAGEVSLGPGLYFVRLTVDGRDAGARKLIIAR